MQRVIVTGASGFIGKSLAKALGRDPAYEVIAVDRNVDPTPGTHTRVCLDVAQPNALDPYLSDEALIFHMAASADVAASVKTPTSDFYNNVVGLIAVLESARRYGCRVLFPSSASVYDRTNVLPLSERAYAKPSSPYGAAKLAGEAYCATYFRCYGLDVRIARMFNVYGPGMRRFAIYDFVRKIHADPREITILGDGTQIRDYLYIDDAIRGFLMIMQDGQPGEDYNLASGVPTQLGDLALNVATLMRHADIVIKRTGQSFPGDVQRWYADISKIRDLGYEPRVPMVEGLRATVDWLLTNVFTAQASGDR